MSCGCNSGSSTPSQATQQAPVHTPTYSDPVQPSACTSSHTDRHFEGLSRANGLELPGLIRGHCFRILAGLVPGFLINKPDGKTYVTDQIDVVLPENASYQRNPDGSIVFENNQPVKAAPYAVSWLVGMVGGIWRSLVGRAGERQHFIWDGSQWVLENVPTWGGSRPITDYPVITTPCGAELLGIHSQREAFTDECGNTGSRLVATVGRLGYMPALVGEIKTWAGRADNIPPGYLYCDGQTLSATLYPDLFAVLGYSWGGTSDSFQVPDLRGRFLRGLDNAAGRDASSSRTVGSYQDDAVIQHGHSSSFSQTDSPSANFQLKLGSAAAPEGGEQTVGVYSATGTLGNETISANVTGVGVSGNIGNVTGTTKVTSETRPKNAAVNYIIFAGCQAVTPE